MLSCLRERSLSHSEEDYKLLQDEENLLTKFVCAKNFLRVDIKTSKFGSNCQLIFASKLCIDHTFDQL